MTTRRDTVRQALALAAVGAGAIHLALGPEHMSEWAVLGSGFYLSGVLQVLLGGFLLRAESRRLLMVATASSLVFIGVWLLSRTTGLPLGPEDFHPEAVGRADVLCIALEAVVAVGALTLTLLPAAGLAPAGRLAARAIVAAVAGVVLTTTGVAIAAPHEHELSHSHEACPPSPVESGRDANGNGADDGVEAYFQCVLTHSHAHA